MKINLSQIAHKEGAAGNFKFEEEFPSFQFGNENLSFSSPVHVELQVINTGKELLVQGRIKTKITVDCGRCLEKFEYPLDLNVQDEWVSRAQATEEQQETALLFDKDEIEINERIKEQIVLALPMKFICSSECRGLCSICGTNLNLESCSCSTDNIDPRFAVLEKWPRGD